MKNTSTIQTTVQSTELLDRTKMQNDVGQLLLPISWETSFPFRTRFFLTLNKCAWCGVDLALRWAMENDCRALRINHGICRPCREELENL